MAEQGPQLVIELFAGTEDSPPRITIRSSAEAPTTIVPASVEDAPEYPPAPRKKAARKKKAAAKKKKAARKKKTAKKKAAGKLREWLEGEQEAGEAVETATATVEVPANGRRKKKKAGKKKKAARGKRGRQPFPDRQTLKATDGDATAELFRRDKKWYLNVDGTDVGDGSGWISRKQALQAAAEILGEFEVVE